MRLTAQQLRSRFALDYRVVTALDGPVIAVRAFRSSSDLESSRNPITTPDDGHLAQRYRIDYHVPTLIGPGRWQQTTSVGFDLFSADNYPFGEPVTSVISAETPYSPHFRKGAPVCIGEFWQEANGQLLLAHLVLHVARLLNWDEVARGGGYQGWNGEAIRYHRQHYGNRALNPDLKLPVPPVHLTHDALDDALLFSSGHGAAPRRNDDDLFAPAG